MPEGGRERRAERVGAAPPLPPAPPAAEFVPYPPTCAPSPAVPQVHAALERCIQRGMSKLEAVQLLARLGVAAKFTALGAPHRPPAPRMQQDHAPCPRRLLAAWHRSSSPCVSAWPRPQGLAAGQAVAPLAKQYCIIIIGLNYFLRYLRPLV